MDLSFSDLNLQLDGLPPINFNSVKTLPGFEDRAAFTVNSATVFRENVDIMPTIVDNTILSVPWDGISVREKW